MWLDLILGSHPKTRIRIARSLAAAGVGTLALVIQNGAAAAGLANPTHATVLTAVALLFLFANYLAIRTGWSNRWSDPALTMPQMVLSIVLMAVVYAINPPIRGITTLFMAMTLVFGAYILPPEKCRQLGWLAVLALGLVMLAGAKIAPQSFEPRIEAFHFLLAALVLTAIATTAGQLSALRQQQKTQEKSLREALDKVQQLATRDVITGLPNRRLMLELLAQEERKSDRQQNLPCCCLIDLDHFKRINDTLGHQAGDEALHQFARIVGSRLRGGDVMARWGGEEFLLLLPATAIDEAALVVERLRGICADPASWGDSPQMQVTFSAGLAAHQRGNTMAQSIARADAALYQAKQSGRNRLAIDDGDPGPPESP